MKLTEIHIPSLIHILTHKNENNKTIIFYTKNMKHKNDNNDINKFVTFNMHKFYPTYEKSLSKNGKYFSNVGSILSRKVFPSNCSGGEMSAGMSFQGTTFTVTSLMGEHPESPLPKRFPVCSQK